MCLRVGVGGEKASNQIKSSTSFICHPRHLIRPACIWKTPKGRNWQIESANAAITQQYAKPISLCMSISLLFFDIYLYRVQWMRALFGHALHSGVGCFVSSGDGQTDNSLPQRDSTPPHLESNSQSN